MSKATGDKQKKTGTLHPFRLLLNRSHTPPTSPLSCPTASQTISRLARSYAVSFDNNLCIQRRQNSQKKGATRIASKEFTAENSSHFSSSGFKTRLFVRYGISNFCLEVARL